MKTATGLFLMLLMAGVAAPATLEEQAHELERLLIAPCCWRRPVATPVEKETPPSGYALRLERALRELEE